MSKNVLYGKPSGYDQNRDRVNKPHAFFYLQDGADKYEAVVNVESREGGEPANDMFFRVLVSDNNVAPPGNLYQDDVEVATKEQTTVVTDLLQRVQGVVTAKEPNLLRFNNTFNYQQLWTDNDVVTKWHTRPHQGNGGLFQRLQSIYDNFGDAAERWYFIGKKFSRLGLDLVHMNAGAGAPDGLILIQVEQSKWVAVFFAFQVDFYNPDTQPGPFRPHPSAPSNIEITNVNYNPPGDDLGNESITLRNNGAADVELEGWKITATRSSTERRYVLPPITLHAEQELEIFITEELFPNKGATVALKDTSDRIIAATEYSP